MFANSMLTSMLLTIHQGQTGGRGLSPRLWTRARGQMLSADGAENAFFIGDDFNLFQGLTNAISGTTALPSTTVPSVDGYQVYLDSTTTASGISRLADVTGGVARFAPGATDNHLAIGYSGNLGAISDTAGSDKLTIFETRLRLHTQVTDGSIFAGLASPGAVADGGLIADAGGLKADQGGIGFQVKEDDPDAIDFVYQAASQTQQVVISGVQAAVADTYYKLGFVYDPKAPTANRIRIFVDNDEQSTYVTGTNIAAATFPDGDFLGAYLAAMTEGTTSRGMDVDWWAFYQFAS